MTQYTEHGTVPVDDQPTEEELRAHEELVERSEAESEQRDESEEDAER
jgi:hypothetical protein